MESTTLLEVMWMRFIFFSSSGESMIPYIFFARMREEKRFEMFGNDVSRGVLV
jgi:hypothetical protein